MTNDFNFTLHADGTVSYWSIYRRQWMREARVPRRELAAMSESDRTLILEHTRVTP